MANVTGADQRDMRTAAKRAWTPWPVLALSALLGAMFLANVDVAVANVASPSIRAGLHASGGELELVVSGYTLAYAVLLVTCARLGQACGYRPMFLAGTGGFTVASLMMTLLGAGGLGLGTGFTGMLGHLTSSVGASTPPTSADCSIPPPAAAE